MGNCLYFDSIQKQPTLEVNSVNFASHDRYNSDLCSFGSGIINQILFYLIISCLYFLPNKFSPFVLIVFCGRKILQNLDYYNFPLFSDDL